MFHDHTLTTQFATQNGAPVNHAGQSQPATRQPTAILMPWEHPLRRSRYVRATKIDIYSI
jgi:hypothetical protein